ncbi:helix-turn-helix domain-containing protein [Vibrio vulnificus]|uniref:helix-turn-helix domain-containing protein n=1 Tax=Vibrio vulnificus TaxID=672 RepID=UPI0015938470|nr:helix-turn-helix transcriptional regulator [Vibrio vulnificus]EGQ8092877.1 helix-turn-helix transcriptional regulator [Vibrio vulnificus]EHH0743578.1 helix-turn-helix transcriptional regulator [Vibrio vulnificus]EJE8554836.1 helix-turn-helix transcriptional regulator [Vibrio vulnificus]NVD21402.1 helix-turn-helix transcriptional regulator [Vibrio vulnificus]
MFGEYLKQLRISLNLTQTELAAKLNLADTEFQSLDAVTVSRWERGKTTPTLRKCISVLRCLKVDLSDFYELIPAPKEATVLDEIFRLRFDNHLARLSSSSYEFPDEPQSSIIVEDRLLSKSNDSILDNLRAFYANSNYIPKGLFDIDLYDYQQSGRAVCKKFTTEDDQLKGHSLSFIFESEYFDKVTHSKGFDIDLKKTVSYKSTVKLSVCNYSRYSSTSEVFQCMLASQYVNLVKHTNVQRYYLFNALPETGYYLEKIGFRKVAFDSESNVGGFNLGSRTFERCLYEIDTAALLSSPEVIKLIKRTHWVNNYLD